MVAEEGVEQTSSAPKPPILANPLIRIGVGVAVAILLLGIGFWKCTRLIDQRLRAGEFSGTSDIYAASPAALITNVSERNREKRRIVRFDEIPKDLVNAILAAEDKRFFRHEGFDPLRILKAAYVDFKDGRKEQGASTLSMQLARSLALAPKKTWRRKLIELLMAVRLEQKLSKKEILEYYCNQVYVGRRGAFSLRGFGAAASAYFGKDLSAITLPEAAALAGLVQKPGYYDPSHNQGRLLERRNFVLSRMRKNGYIGESEYEKAITAPLGIASGSGNSSGASYFIDLAAGELQRRMGAREAPEVYTTLDLRLQDAANEAVRSGMREVDERLRRRAGKRAGLLPKAQVALVALDPHTGEVKALVGGRDYAASQLNRALAKRQPGSAFKPFVYAAALNRGLASSSLPITPATLVSDEPTTFANGSQPYTPANFGHTFSGDVTVREALAKSMNVPTVKLAQMIGYRSVAKLARNAGLGDNIQPTPSIALGAYEATPLDVAAAYTIFANQGVYIKPSLIRQVRTRAGRVFYTHAPETHRVLDPRVAYLMVNLMEGVLRSGTGAGVRSRGFLAPAAGKTGTSHDGWFAGFTSQLLCVVWVGFDDNRELDLEGAKSALPIWTEFMKKALAFPPYGETKPFEPPSGITSAVIDPETGELASPNCPTTRTEFFLSGTQPTEICSRHDETVIVNEHPELSR